MEINDPEEPTPPLETDKAIIMVSTSVKLKDNQCGPISLLERPFTSVPDSRSMAFKRHRPLKRQFSCHGDFRAKLYSVLT